MTKVYDKIGSACSPIKVHDKMVSHCWRPETRCGGYRCGPAGPGMAAILDGLSHTAAILISTATRYKRHYFYYPCFWYLWLSYVGIFFGFFPQFYGFLRIFHYSANIIIFPGFCFLLLWSPCNKT